MEKMLVEFSGGAFFGRPYRSNDTKTPLDVAFLLINMSQTICERAGIKHWNANFLKLSLVKLISQQS